MITAKEAAQRVKEIKNGQTIEYKMKNDADFRRNSLTFQNGFRFGQEFMQTEFDIYINSAINRGVHYTTVTLMDNTQDTGEWRAFLEGTIEAILTEAQAIGYSAVGKVFIKPIDKTISIDIGLGW